MLVMLIIRFRPWPGPGGPAGGLHSEEIPNEIAFCWVSRALALGY